MKKQTVPSPILVGGIEEISLNKLDPRDIEKYLWMHPIVPRGIEIKANSMIRRGYRIKPSSESTPAQKARDEMERLLRDSGGLIAVKRWIEDAYGFGTGFKTLVENKNGKRILRLNPEHPIYFRVTKYPDNYKDKEKRGKYKIDPRTKEPITYTQVIWDKQYDKWVPIGEDIPADRVAALYFDTWGDEKIGISVVQYLHLALKYIMNIEEAGAETTYRNGFIQKKVTTEITNEKDLKKLGKTITEINRRDAIILPKGTDVFNLNPGQIQLKEIHQVYILLLASRLGIPLPYLTLDGTSTNKATIQEMAKLMYADFSADELIVKQAIESQIFKPACELLYGEDFDEIPIFEFKEVAEDKELRADRLARESLAILNLTNAAQVLTELQRTEDADLIITYLREYLNLDDRIENLKENNPRND